MTIKAIYPTLEDVPEAHRELFEERGGQYHLKKIDGFVTEADVSRVRRALEQEKASAKELKDGQERFLNGRTFEEIQAVLDRVPELEAASKGAIDETKMEELVDGRVRTKLAPVERERDQLKTKLSQAEEIIKGHEEKDRKRVIHDAVRQAAINAKVLDTAQEDVLMLAERIFEVSEEGNVTVRDGMGATPGISPDVWLTEIQAKRPHWWPASKGGGGTGSGGGTQFPNNPWSKSHWNLTQQGVVIRTLGQEKAEQMAKSAGSAVGATRPPAN